MVKTFKFKQSDLGAFKSANVAPIISRLAKDSRIMGLTMGEFSLIDLIHGVLKKTGKANVVCVTWSAGIKDAHNVKWMMDTGLLESFTLVTDHSYKTRQKKYALTIDELFGEENIRTSEIHAKFVLIWNEEWNVCIRTSMNLNANKTCESFEMDEDKEIFEFYKGFVDHLVDFQKPGFVSSSKVVGRTLDSFFATNSESIKGWSEM